MRSGSVNADKIRYGRAHKADMVCFEPMCSAAVGRKANWHIIQNGFD